MTKDDNSPRRVRYATTEVARLEEMVAKRKAKLADAEAKLDGARARLAELKG